MGPLHAAEERLEDKVEQITDKAGRLLLAEEDWLEKHKHRFQSNQKDGGSSGGSHGKTKTSSSGSNKSGVVKVTSEGTPHRKGRCRNCGIYGHWDEDCKRPKKQKKEKEEKREEANVAMGGVDHHPAPLMATVHDIKPAPMQMVHLAKKNVVPVDCPDGVWVLDTGASNHMTGTRSALSYLDTGVRGTVGFGDGSCVEIHGVGSVVMKGQHQEHKVLTDVYFIPKLKSNIVSLGQLEERGCEVSLKNGRLKVFDQCHVLLVSALRTAN